MRVAVQVVVKDGMALAEGAALGILAGETDANSLRGKTGKSEAPADW